MKIAIFHELPMGGARRVANELAGQLKKRGHIVDLYIVDGVNPRQEYKYYNKIFFFKFTPKKWNGSDWKARLYKDTIELLNLNRLHKLIAYKLDKYVYDSVIVHPSKFTQAPFILRYTKTRKIYFAHEVYRMIYDSAFRYKKSVIFYKYFYEILTRGVKQYIDLLNTKSADKIIVNSKFTQKGYLKFYNKKSTVIYPGVNTDFFYPRKMKKDIDVLFVGSMDQEADEVLVLLKAVRLVKSKVNLKLLRGGEKWVEDDELRSYYRRSKIVVCTAHNEPFGLVPLEAGACGVPVIAVNEGGYKETVINGTTGLLVKRNSTQLAGDIKKLLKNPTLLEKLGKNAKNNVLKSWTLKMSAARLEKQL